MREIAAMVRARWGVIAVIGVFTLTLGLIWLRRELTSTPNYYTPAREHEFYEPGPVWDGGLAQPPIRARELGVRLPDQDPAARFVMLTRAEIEAYADHPFYWFGERYRGYNLQPPFGSVRPSDVRLNLYYGQVIPHPGKESDGPAIWMSIQDGCKRRPYTPDGAPIDKLKTVRGGALLAEMKNGYVQLWTGPILIYIVDEGDSTRAKRAVKDLRGWGPAAAHIGPRDPLPPPDFSRCPAQATAFPVPISLPD